MADVFISYCRTDRPVIEVIVAWSVNATQSDWVIKEAGVVNHPRNLAMIEALNYPTL